MSDATQMCSSANLSGTMQSSCLNVAEKFRAYRMGVESSERQLKDANSVIERLKDEINSSRESEKNLRNQMLSAQNRLIYLQQALKNFFTVSEQQRQTEKISKEIEQKIEKIQEEIKKIRGTSQNFTQHASKEIDLLKEIRDLKSVLAGKERQLDLMKMEIQTLIAEKKTLETSNQQKFRSLEHEFEKLKQKETEKEINYGHTLMYYRQQLEEKDQKIKLYEKERKNFLDDFEPLAGSEDDSNLCTGMDNSVADTAVERPSKASHTACKKLQTESKDFDAFQCSQTDKRSKSKKNNRSQPVASKKQKPQLDFLTDSQNSPPSTNSAPKRRLFSTNCNHYTD